MELDSDASRKRVAFHSLTVAALGVVFGDIGTSPLYAIREAFYGPHAIAVTPANVLGVLSLIVWSMILVISVKYLFFVMRADNRGEGGVLALTTLAFPAKMLRSTPWLHAFLYFGLFGSALLVGDGIITPAISVLSAVEGLEVATPLFSPYIIPITLGILTVLFLNQHHGSGRIGAVFGYVVLVWFLTIGALGVRGIIDQPEILSAIDPSKAYEFFSQNGWTGITVLGAVFLVVTGGEALYADMGHFGKRPIQTAWLLAALPGLLLNYFGQGALLLAAPEHAVNPFYRLAPDWALYPLVLIATMATVIASQAVISGVFSLSRQAVQLGYAPRFQVVHTSKDEIGQIYISHINWGLFVLTCWLVLEFRSSSALASAYGIAVSATMVITTILACLVALNQWKWGTKRVFLIFVFFFSIDAVFLGANFSKIADGGWFPLTVGGVIFTLMTTWRRGRQILAERLREKSLPVSEFAKQIESYLSTTRVEGTAVFMTGNPDGTPNALLHNVKHNKVLHNTNVIMTVITEEVPHVSAEERVDVISLKNGIYKVTAHYGFMEKPSINDIFRACKKHDLKLGLNDTTFFLGRETLLATNRPGMAKWRQQIFSFMSRNAERATAYFDIPPQQVVEIGIQVEL
ncbi:MAG: potassium transporter Kup [Deltaproteobacteria bacterium]|nr:potassium transporter Kup [Deltaproteobacteria bacterium]